MKERDATMSEKLLTATLCIQAQRLVATQEADCPSIAVAALVSAAQAVARRNGFTAEQLEALVYRALTTRRPAPVRPAVLAS